MDAIIDEILYLYFSGYYLNDILKSIKSTSNQKKKKNNKVVKKYKAPEPIKEEYINLGPAKTNYPKSITKAERQEYEALEFNKALKSKLNLNPGVVYKILATKRKKCKVCFIGKFKEQNERHIRLQHKQGYSETFLKSDLISGEYLIKEA